MKIFMTILSLCIAQMAWTQRLPDLQTKVVTVPSNVKIDGLDSEWGEYAAKNRKLDISYSIANDRDFLYLVMKAEKDSKEYNKITTSGFQFSVNVENKNNSDQAFKVSYPTRPASTGNSGGMATTMMTVVGTASGGSFNFTTGDREAMMRRADSVMRATRTNRLNQAKEIKVFNFPAITDSLISIYNEYDIKVAAKFTEKDEYVYEMAIPLSLLGLEASSAKEVAYQLRSNPIITRRISEEEIRSMIPAGALPAEASVTFRGGGGGGAGDGGFNEALIPAEVWGKYKLHALQ